MKPITSPAVRKPILFVIWIAALLALTLPASPAHAGGVVSICDESHLKSALTGGGTVTFTCSGTITLTTSILVSANTTIDGSGQSVTISGNNTVRVFIVSTGVNLELSGLTIANGKSQGSYGGGIFHNGNTLVVSKCTFSGNRADAGGAGIYNFVGQVTVSNSIFSANSGSQSGGAIYNDRTLTVNNTTFSGNSAGFVGGAIFNNGSMSVNNSTFSGNSAGTDGGGTPEGGAIYSSDMATVSSSTFSGNTTSGNGGGIYHSGSLTVSNSTFSGNSAKGFGGAIALDGTLTIANSTISGNSASSGGGITNFYVPVSLKNTIVANNTVGGNCAGFITDYGGNLSYPDKTCPGINANPLLGPLQNNGGPTQTMALGAGSPAIDAGNTAACQIAQLNNRDQRGYARFIDGNGDKVASCDIGAFEYGASGPPTAVLDQGPPEVSIELTPETPDGANGWYRSPVTVQPQAEDASPVIDLRCALDPASPPAAFDDLPAELCPFLGGAEVSAEGRYTFYAAAMDIWGNKSAPVSREFKIDTPPLGPTILEMTVNREQAYAGAILEYRLKVRNLTPSAQAFAVTDPIPANTEIVRRIHYNPATNAVEWSGVVEPWGFRTFTVYVRIKSGTPGGTAIVNTATLEDEPGGGSASATTIVKTLPPYRGHRADVAVNEVVIRGK